MPRNPKIGPSAGMKIVTGEPCVSSKSTISYSASSPEASSASERFDEERTNVPIRDMIFDVSGLTDLYLSD